MAEPYATVDDYIDQTGAITLPPARVKQVESLLAAASAMIRPRLPAGYEPDPEVTKAIVIQMVERRLTNPGGRRSKTVGQTSETFDQDGGLYLSDSELDLILAGYNQDDDQPQAYTIRLRDEAYAPGPYDDWRW